MVGITQRVGTHQLINIVYPFTQLYKESQFHGLSMLQEVANYQLTLKWVRIHLS